MSHKIKIKQTYSHLLTKNLKTKIIFSNKARHINSTLEEQEQGFFIPANKESEIDSPAPIRNYINYDLFYLFKIIGIVDNFKNNLYDYISLFLLVNHNGYIISYDKKIKKLS